MPGDQTDTREPATAPPLHVLHVADAETHARCGPMLAEALRALCAAGLRVSLVTDDAGLVFELASSPAECFRVPHLAGWRARRLDDLLTDQLSPPQVVHLWGTAGLYAIAGWTRRTAVPLLIHAFGASQVEHLARRGLRPGEHVAVASDALAAPLLRRIPQAAGRCKTIPPAAPAPPPPAAGSETEHTLSVLCVTGLREGCGLDILIDAVAQLRRRQCDVQVAVIGRGVLPGAVWRRIRTAAVHDCVSVINEPGLWPKVLGEVDVCVVPGCQREFWAAPLAAMNLGKVVIAAREQLADWFIEDRTAWQFTPGSAVELAYLLTRAMEQPRQAAALGATAAAHVRTHYGLGGLVERLTALYGALCGGKDVAVRAENTSGRRDV